jgi:hypothetical protein
MRIGFWCWAVLAVLLSVAGCRGSGVSVTGGAPGQPAQSVGEAGAVRLTLDAQLGLFSARSQPYQSYGAPLSSFAGQKVKLAWYFTSDGGVTYEGWYLDEIRAQARPKVTGVSPNPVANGQQLTINGTGFGAGGADDFPGVTVAGTAAAVVNWTSTQIVVTVPATVASGDVVVTNHRISGDGFPVKVKLPAPGSTGLGQL